MGKNKVQVVMETSKTTSEQVRTSAWNDNGRKINTLTPLLRKLLTGLSIGQLVIVAISAATIGAFVNSNMKEIDVLKQRTDDMEETINQLITNQDGTVNLKQSYESQRKLAEIEAKVTDVQTGYETEFLELSSNLTEIKADQTSLKSTVLDLGTRIKQLESVNDDTCNATMLQDHDERIRQIEASIVDIDDISQVSKNITELQNEMSVQIATLLDHETRLTQIELLMESNDTFNDSKIQGYDKRIAKLEADNIIISDSVQSLGTAITQVELSRTEDRENIWTLNETIEQLASCVAVQNISDRLSVFVQETQLNSDAIEDNVETLSQLDLNMNVTMALLYNLESKVSTIEDEAIIYAQFRSEGDLTFEKGGKLVFSNNSKIANAGNAFNPDIGVFESPVDGLYYFSVGICFYEPGHWTGFFIMQKDVDEELGIQLARGQVGNKYGGHCSGASAAAYLRKGSQVWTEYGLNSKGVLTVHTPRSFSAVLLNTRMLEENNP